MKMNVILQWKKNLLNHVITKNNLPKLTVQLILAIKLSICLLFDPLMVWTSNSLDPDQARHYVKPDLDPRCLTL